MPVSALKKAEDRQEVILRLFNPLNQQPVMRLLLSVAR